jgi:hypothetical protein
MFKNTFKYTDIYDIEETYKKFLYFQNKNIGSFNQIINIKSITIKD